MQNIARIEQKNHQEQKSILVFKIAIQQSFHINEENNIYESIEWENDNLLINVPSELDNIFDICNPWN